MTIDIDAIRQREQAATEGPWLPDRVDIKPDVFNPSRPNHRVLTPTGSLSAFCGEGAEGEANAEFIAHARTDVPALLAKVDELTAALAERAAQLTAANRRADGAEADLNSATKANTAWANQGRPCLIVTCADCGEKFEYDGCTLHFKDLDEARSIIEDEEWRVIDGQPMCGDCCRYKPHPFTPGAPPTELTCQRCDLEEDDHEAASTTTEAVAR